MEVQIRARDTLAFWVKSRVGFTSPFQQRSLHLTFQRISHLHENVMNMT